MMGWACGRFFAAVLAIAIQRDQFHRPRAIEGVGGDQIVQPVRPHLHQQILHSAGFKLEDALGFAAAKQVEHFPVGEVDLFNVDVDSLDLLAPA